MMWLSGSSQSGDHVVARRDARDRERAVGVAAHDGGGDVAALQARERDPRPADRAVGLGAGVAGAVGAVVREATLRGVVDACLHDAADDGADVVRVRVRLVARADEAGRRPRGGLARVEELGVVAGRALLDPGVPVGAALERRRLDPVLVAAGGLQAAGRDDGPGGREHRHRVAVGAHVRHRDLAGHVADALAAADQDDRLARAVELVAGAARNGGGAVRRAERIAVPVGRDLAHDVREMRREAGHARGAVERRVVGLVTLVPLAVRRRVVVEDLDAERREREVEGLGLAVDDLDRAAVVGREVRAVDLVTVGDEADHVLAGGEVDRPAVCEVALVAARHDRARVGHEALEAGRRVVRAGGRVRRAGEMTDRRPQAAAQRRARARGLTRRGGLRVVVGVLLVDEVLERRHRIALGDRLEGRQGAELHAADGGAVVAAAAGAWLRDAHRGVARDRLDREPARHGAGRRVGLDQVAGVELGQESCAGARHRRPGARVVRRQGDCPGQFDRVGLIGDGTRRGHVERDRLRRRRLRTYERGEKGKCKENRSCFHAIGLP